MIYIASPYSSAEKHQMVRNYMAMGYDNFEGYRDTYTLKT